MGDDILTGDINLDGKLSVSDVVLLQKYLIKSGKLTADQAKRADLNRDGVLNAYDLALLKHTMLGK
ncbi:dockerin type I repeat-containing protein [Ruminococcus champanellensis]|uniref:dockerin type I repeat-containing protein n=1 Tax=Ruminococcus champanellensis TaxID=1161942 RepID=UPI0030B8D124